MIFNAPFDCEGGPSVEVCFVMGEIHDVVFVHNFLGGDYSSGFVRGIGRSHLPIHFHTSIVSTLRRWSSSRIIESQGESNGFTGLRFGIEGDRLGSDVSTLLSFESSLRFVQSSASSLRGAFCCLSTSVSNPCLPNAYPTADKRCKNQKPGEDHQPEINSTLAILVLFVADLGCACLAFYFIKSIFKNRYSVLPVECRAAGVFLIIGQFISLPLSRVPNSARPFFARA
jgi:hypothetical protein